MATRVVARILLTIGFVAASLGYGAWTAQRTILDPAATRGATHALLSTPAVRTALAREIRTALAPALGSSARNPKLTGAIDAAVADPVFVAAFQDAIVSLHREILSGGKHRVTLDTRAVTAAINRAVAKADPAMAAKVRKLKSVRVPIGGSEVPHVGDALRTVTRVRNLAIAIAILLIGGALALAHDRKMFRRAGVRLALLALPTVLVFGVTPHLLASSHGSSSAVGAALLEAYGHRVLFSAGVLAVLGISTWLIAVALPARRRSEAKADAPATAPFVPPIAHRTPSSEAGGLIPEKLYL